MHVHIDTAVNVAASYQDFLLFAVITDNCSRCITSMSSPPRTFLASIKESQQITASSFQFNMICTCFHTFISPVWKNDFRFYRGRNLQCFSVVTNLDFAIAAAETSGESTDALVKVWLNPYLFETGRSRFDTQDILVIELTYAAKGIMVKRNHIVIGHFCFIHRTVFAQGIPSLPSGSGTGFDLIHPAAAAFVQQQVERKLFITIVGKQWQDMLGSEKAGLHTVFFQPLEQPGKLAALFCTAQRTNEGAGLAGLQLYGGAEQGDIATLVDDIGVIASFFAMSSTTPSSEGVPKKGSTQQ